MVLFTLMDSSEEIGMTLITPGISGIPLSRSELKQLSVTDGEKPLLTVNRAIIRSNATTKISWTWPIKWILSI
jgi:hypothetical protein